MQKTRSRGRPAQSRPRHRRGAESRRVPDFPVEHVFVDRWSPRAMSGQPLEREQLMSLFEAARWAPSSFNAQPWRFVYVMRASAHWDELLKILDPSNQVWAKNAGALVVITSRRISEKTQRPLRTHSFDTGTAWGYLALQGWMQGLVVHGMEGFDHEGLRRLLRIPGEFTVEAMAAVGLRGRREDLPAELREEEFPKGRKHTSEIAFEGHFRKGGSHDHA